MACDTVVPLRRSVRDLAHEAIRDCLDLTGALNEAASFPGSLTESDREVLLHRLEQLNKAVRAIAR